MNSERLQKLADFLRKLPPNQFYFGSVVTHSGFENQCGTVACAIGWTPAVFPELVEWTGKNDRGMEESGLRYLPNPDKMFSYIRIGAELFDLSLYDSEWLFSPDDDGETHGVWSEASPAEVAELIESFIRRNS